jgi:predicted metal-dependent hydrolase
MTDHASHTINFGGEVVSFAIERTTRRKTVAISVGYDGIRVLAPADLDDSRIVGIVRQKGPWVLRKQAGYRELGGAPLVREFVSGETYLYLGRQYRLRILPTPETVVSRITARGLALMAPVPAELDASLRKVAIRSALRHWYRDRAKAHLPTRVAAMANLLGIPTPSVRIVDQSKRWGSCDAKGHIRLNWRLIMAPTSLIDYVIAHEVCHVLEHNHSRRFWRSLETIMPDYESRVKKLDRAGYLLSL